MKLWVDGQCFQTSSRNRGIGRYAMELLRAISEGHPEVELHLSLNAQMVPEAIAARRGLSGILPPHRIHLWHGVTTKGEAVEGYTPSRRLSELALVHHVNCIAPDVALSLSPFEGVGDPVVPLLQSKYLKAPAYAIFYDAIPIRFQEQYLNAPILKQVYMRRMDACRDFDDLLCISEFALLEARDLLSISGGVNISAGVSRNFESLLGGQAQSTKSARRDFLLYVGALDWRKNVELIPKAFSLLPEALKTRLDVLLVGDHPAEMLKPIFDLWRSLGLPAASLRSMGLVSDETLFSLYRSAKAVIQPSLMEGFGLTALEALTCGTPVIAARAGALPEVVGSDRLMFDPQSPQELASRIENVCTDESLRASIMQNRAGLAERFSWDKTASIAVASLESALSNDGSTPVQKTEELRRFIVPAIREYAGSTETIAQALAFAEPFAVTKPRLFVDASSTIRNQLRSGIQRVVRRICTELEKSGGGEKYDVQIIFCDDESGWYRTQSDLISAPEKSERNRVKPIYGDVILMLDSSWDLAGIHRGFLNEARMVGAKIVSCMFDTVPLRLPGFCLPVMPPVFRDWLLGALQYSSGFVCISKAVADELRSLLENMNYPHEVEIGHWRLGADFLSSEVSETHRFEADSQNPNFLMVGTLEPRKGQSMVIDAFEKGWQSGLEANLTIVGKYGWEAQHLATRIRTHPEYRKRLHWLDRVEDDELQRLYATCDALISASYGEGFGLPIVEAGQLGVPVIASDIPVFREVAAAARQAVFFETGSPESLLKTIRKFIRTPPKAKPGPPASWPSWSQSADELLDVVIGGKTGRYQPAADQPFLLPTELGTVRMRGPLETRDQDFWLRLVSGPEPMDEDGSQKILVGVTNLSPRPWFGRGDDGGNYGVALSYHVRAAEGEMLQYDNPRSNIVLALQPGDTHIIAVVIPGIWRDRGAASVEIELVQEGVSWWGNPLCVSLLPPAAALALASPVTSAAHSDAR